ncbi:kinase-like domain-containing protein [Fusarium flagelliforme]|uniref:Tkl protein kinase n=1 Tax=Fusarium flagelliforme TaxID=2675880 RepID=A0A395M6Z6_9HYPO|nr:kinase-like domain-containing protein [Fusarium flagelliforme]KAH7179059.1 kinase-like domain-containing protein [Fusarium flagelliforme]RFN43657.1 tkl protein kinase [Fusarium flagelliforme]
MPTPGALSFVCPFPNGDSSTNMNPILGGIWSLQTNRRSNNATLLDYVPNATFCDVEAKIYEALGPHEHILRPICLIHYPESRARDPWLLEVERAPHGNLRDRITQGNAPPMATRMRMALDLAETLQHIHSRKVIWNAVYTRHILLFDNFHIKLFYFSFSRRDDDFFIGSRRLVCQSNLFSLDSGYDVPELDYHSDKTVLQRELFMLGMCICEITEWAIPYGENSREEMEEKRRIGWLPDVSVGNPAEDVMEKLWCYKYSSVQEVADDIRKLVDRMSA